MEPSHSPSSLKKKFRSSFCLSCCFRKSHDQPLTSPSEKPKFIRSSSLRIKTRAQDIPDKCRNLFSRIGRHHSRHSADFRYDPLSYSLNFDHGGDGSLYDDSPRDFSSRLPQSPPRESEEEAAVEAATPVSAGSKEISACS